MLTFQDHFRQAGRWQRRQFLRAGALGLGGLTLADRFAVQAAAGALSPLKDKSVIFLFMHGGPSQFETFDPKMEASSSIRSTTGEIKTTLPGMTLNLCWVRIRCGRIWDRFIPVLPAPRGLARLCRRM